MTRKRATTQLFIKKVMARAMGASHSIEDQDHYENARFRRVGQVWEIQEHLLRNTKARKAAAAVAATSTSSFSGPASTAHASSAKTAATTNESIFLPPIPKRGQPHKTRPVFAGPQRTSQLTRTKREQAGPAATSNPKRRKKMNGTTLPSRSTPTGNKENGIEPSISSFIFLGTGTSSQVPAIGCLTNPRTRCTVCPSALHPATQKNRRRNTSALVTLTNNKTILIDCGKSFFDAALQIWPRARLCQIDAVLLTHAHADAMNGLDDLRGWTLGGFVQSGMDVYCSQPTYDSVKSTFPYMIDAAAATGGGDIPTFRWHVIPEDGEFEIASCGGVKVTTLPVEHGMTFGEKPAPFMCLGFGFGRQLAYISDASHIPDATREKLQGLEVAVLDALRKGRHASHMSIPETLDFVNGMERPPRRTLLVDFTHDVDHYAFEAELKKTQKLSIEPAYDGLQLVFGENGGVTDVDLLGERQWIAVCEQDGGHSRGKGKVGGMV